jgi:hypothetical protein
MDSFDSIQCEEYYEAFGTEQEQFEQWMQALEEEELAEVNAELRTVVFVQH